MKKYSTTAQDDLEMGVKQFSWATNRENKSDQLSQRENILNQFVKGDSDPIVVIISGCPSVAVCAQDDVCMHKIAAFDPSELGEIFLSRGYKVLYIHHKHDSTPFSSVLNELMSGNEENLISRLSTIGNSIQLNSGSNQLKLSHAIKSQKEAVERGYLLNLSCDKLEHYIHAIVTTSSAIRTAGANIIWACCWDLPSNRALSSESGRRHFKDYNIDDSRSRSSRNSVGERKHLPFTDSLQEDIPELLYSFRDECDADGLVVSMGIGTDETDTLDKIRVLMAKQNVDIVVGVAIERSRRAYLLVDRRDLSTVLRMAVTKRKTKTQIESAVATAIIAKHRELYPHSISPVTPTVVSRLATNYIEERFDIHTEGASGSGKSGNRPHTGAGSEEVRVGTLIRTMTTMAANDELIGHRACMLLCLVSVVAVVGLFALVTYLMRNV